MLHFPHNLVEIYEKIGWLARYDLRQKINKNAKLTVSHLCLEAVASFRTWQGCPTRSCTGLGIFVELIGIEPTTYSLRTNRSPKLSYSPKRDNLK